MNISEILNGIAKVVFLELGEKQQKATVQLNTAKNTKRRHNKLGNERSDKCKWALDGAQSP